MYSVVLKALLISLVFILKWQLLEATARAVQPVLEWGESGLAVADGLSNLLKVSNCPLLA